MSLKDRVLYFIAYKGLTPRGFEIAVGLSNGAVAKMADNTRRSTIDKISNTYPDVNPAWLISGEGDMLRPLPHIDIDQHSEGDHSPNYAANGPLTVTGDVTAAQLLEVVQKHAEQVDRLLTIIEKMQTNQ